MSDARDGDAVERLVRYLRTAGAVGRGAAVTQRRVARAMGWTPREVQQITLAANERGVPVCSACDAPRGVYLAETAAELADYEAQLMARLRGVAARAAHVRRMSRRLRDGAAVDPLTGQRYLFPREAVTV